MTRGWELGLARGVGPGWNGWVGLGVGLPHPFALGGAAPPPPSLRRLRSHPDAAACYTHPASSSLLCPPPAPQIMSSMAVRNTGRIGALARGGAGDGNGGGGGASRPAAAGAAAEAAAASMRAARWVWQLRAGVAQAGGAKCMATSHDTVSTSLPPPPFPHPKTHSTPRDRPDPV